MIAVIVILLILVVIVGGVAYYYFTQKESKPSSGSSTSTLTITENGATLTENYRIMPRREKYLQMPYIDLCYADVVETDRPGYCGLGLHDRTTDGLVFVYDLSINTTGSYNECPGGGHECWYTEKIDQNGNLVDIVDKNGVKLLDKIADDIWTDKWDMNNVNIAPALTMAEFKDKKLISLKDLNRLDGTNISYGKEITINDIPNKSVYFILLMVAMKIAGEPKPARVVLNVSGGKASFDNYVTRRSASSQASQGDTPQ